MKRTIFSLLLPLCMASQTALADSWIYAGISAGGATYQSESDKGYSLHVGTGTLPIIGIEGGIVEHGEFDVKGDSIDLSSYYVALKPSIDLFDFHIYAKAGAHYWGQSRRWSRLTIWCGSGVLCFKQPFSWRFDNELQHR